jgi:hypothetical protein
MEDPQLSQNPRSTFPSVLWYFKFPEVIENEVSSITTHVVNGPPTERLQFPQWQCTTEMGSSVNS